MLQALHLSELLRIIKSYGDPSARDFFATRGKPTREHKFVRAILRTKQAAPAEREIARHVFGDTATEYDMSYLVLRSQVKKRLLGALAHLDLRDGSPRRRAIYRNALGIFRVRVLLLLGARRTAMQLLPRLLREAREFGLTQIAIEALEVLTENAAITGDRAAYRRYDRELTDLFNRAAAEREANRLVQLNTLEFASRAFGYPGIERRARESANRSRELYEKAPSYNTGLAYYRLEAGARELEHNHAGTIAIAREAEALFQAHPQQSTPSVFGEFSLVKLAASFHACNLEDGFEAAKVCEQIYLEGSNNWFTYKGYEFLLNMHAMRFERARAIWDAVESNPRLTAQSDALTQRWQLFERYLLLAEGKVLREKRPFHERSLPDPFAELVREVPIYARDKAGFNIALLILHVYYLLATKQREEITMRIEAMPRYLNRHLRGRRSGATAGFLKTLILLERCSFDLDEFIPMGEKYLNQFLMPKEPVELEDCQALPYPLLWKYFEELLEK